ncbi:MAG: hypothetical protein LBT20_01615, partial [Clostridiales bacterium]|nr:hypothetical protein [Clostridiales bacterium]
MKKYNIEFDCQTVENVSYNHCFSDMALFRRLYVGNAGDQDIEGVVLEISSEPEFLLTYGKEFDVLKSGSVVSVDTGEIKLSPVYLSSLSEKRQGTVSVKLVKDKATIAEFKKEVNILGYYDWDAAETEMLSTFVRPKTFAAVKLLKDAESILTKWKLNAEFTGYKLSDKTKIRNIAAAVFTAIQNLGIKIVPTKAADGIYTFSNLSKILETKEASAHDLMLLYASALEAAGINPILVFGGKTVYAGLWLIDNCFDEIVGDDPTVIKKRLAGGVNEIAVFLIDKLLTQTLSFAGAEKTSTAAFNGETEVTIVDVKRARAGIVRSLPERVKTAKGYDILEEEDLRGAAPKSIVEL